MRGVLEETHLAEIVEELVKNLSDSNLIEADTSPETYKRFQSVVMNTLNHLVALNGPEGTQEPLQDLEKASLQAEAQETPCSDSGELETPRPSHQVLVRQS